MPVTFAANFPLLGGNPGAGPSPESPYIDRYWKRPWFSVNTLPRCVVLLSGSSY